LVVVSDFESVTLNTVHTAGSSVGCQPILGCPILTCIGERMSQSLNKQASVSASVRMMLCLPLLAMAGCVAQVRVAGPPVEHYAPPPPPVYAPPEPVEVQANEPPPPLPDYEQPPVPDEGYVWTPGYWAFGPGGYYWIPGTWVQPPRVGVLWTPGYWGFVGAVYVFHAGYWGPHVGFYGGVNYGYGYGGVGYAGGHWDGNRFAYNRSVTNVNVTVVHNVYNETVINNVTVNKVSYNGGAGGVSAVASVEERRAQQEPHISPTPLQTQHVQEAARNPALFARANGGHPSIAATPKAAVFNAPGVVGTRGVAPVVSTHPEPPANAGGGAHSMTQLGVAGPKVPAPPAAAPGAGASKPAIGGPYASHQPAATPKQQSKSQPKPPPKPQPKPQPKKSGKEHDRDNR
jgi:hypothetical protein